MSPTADIAERRPMNDHALTLADGFAAPLCAALLGLVLLYAVGFAQTEEIHNGAHDSRHAAGFACH